jgi:hypothetical protein
MGFKVGGYSFSGRYSIDKTDEIKDLPGLYAILCRRGRRHYLVDVGGSDTLGSELEGHDRRKMWARNCSGSLVVTVKYTLDLEKLERAQMEKKIRKQHNPPCPKQQELADVSV